MIRSILVAASAAALLTATPAGAQDVKEIVGGIAKQYLQQEQDKAAYAQAQSQNTLAGYQSYLRQFPNGAYASHARAQVERLGGTTTTTTNNGNKPVVVAPPGQSSGQTSGQAAGGANLTARQRVSIQQRLTALGYDTAGADGSFGPGTRRAIALWQRDRSYDQTGTLTSAQATEILRGTRSGGATATAPASGPAQVEAALGLSRSQKVAIQTGLTNRGFSTRGIDGSFGSGTRNAIAGWQRANDMTATGYLTADQVQRLTR